LLPEATCEEHTEIAEEITREPEPALGGDEIFECLALLNSFDRHA
jgi:hypothetical protein